MKENKNIKEKTKAIISKPKVKGTLSPEIFPPSNPAQLRKLLSVAKREIRSAPLPTPDEFEKYDKTLPGAANRILVMAESEQQFRHGFNNNQIEKEYKLKSKGLLLAFIIIIILLVSTIILYWISKDSKIAIALILEISIIAGLFIYWTSKDNKDKNIIQKLKNEIDNLKKQINTD